MIPPLNAYGSFGGARRLQLGPHRGFLAACVVLFIGSVTLTIQWCGSMRGGMAMPGDWTMSMAWMRMPGQSWPLAAVAFLGMWVVMMTSMMSPSLLPELLCYRVAIGEPTTIRGNALTALVGIAYFLVWSLVGVAVYPFGVVVAKAAMASPALARSVPFATSVVLLVAGAFQFTSWKARQLDRCRGIPIHDQWRVQDFRNAWHHGLRLGVDCVLCCSGMMAILLVIGVMNLGSMALITAAISAERLWTEPRPVARATGVVIISVAMFMIAWGVNVR